MANEQHDPFRGTAERLIARKEQEREMAKQNLEAMQRSIKGMYKQMLKDDEIKSAVSQEMIAGVRGETRVSQVLDKLLNKTGQAMNNERGLNSNSIENFGNMDNVPTGQEERYWERED